MFLAAAWTTQSALYMAKTMKKLARRHPESHSHRWEFNKIAFELLPKWGYYIAVFVLCVVFFSQNLANILMTSQVMDDMLLSMFGKSCALDYTNFKGLCVSGDDDTTLTDSLFGNRYVISVGYIVVLVICIPLGILNLDDNIGIQIGGMVLTVVCIVVWVANFIAIGLVPANVPMFGTGLATYAPLLSTVLFNYGFVATIPSWYNEKAPRVKTGVTIVWAQVAASLQYLLVAVFGALAIVNNGNSNLLSLIDEGGISGIWQASQIMTFIFPLANVLTSIPVFSIIIRYNMLQIHGIHVPVWMANLVAVVMPWVVAVPFYPGNTMDDIINWSSALFFVMLNLVFPLSMYLSMEYGWWGCQLHNGTSGTGEAGDHHGGGKADRFVSDDEASYDGFKAGLLVASEMETGFSLNSGENDAGKTDADGLLLRTKPAAPSEVDLDIVHALPACGSTQGSVTSSTKSERHYALGLLGLSVVAGVAAFVMQLLQQVDPAAGGS